MNSSASISLRPNIESFSSKNSIVSVPFTINPSSRLMSILSIPSQYNEYNFLPVFISIKVPSGFAITFHPFLYFGYEQVIFSGFPKITDNSVVLSGYKYIIGLATGAIGKLLCYPELVPLLFVELVIVFVFLF